MTAGQDLREPILEEGEVVGVIQVVRTVSQSWCV